MVLAGCFHFISGRTVWLGAQLLLSTFLEPNPGIHRKSGALVKYHLPCFHYKLAIREKMQKEVQKNLLPELSEWINKWQYIQRLDYCLAIKRMNY